MIKDYNTNGKVERLVTFTSDVTREIVSLQHLHVKKAVRLFNYPQDLIHRHIRECYEHGVSVKDTLDSLYECFC